MGLIRICARPVLQTPIIAQMIEILLNKKKFQRFIPLHHSLSKNLNFLPKLKWMEGDPASKPLKLGHAWWKDWLKRGLKLLQEDDQLNCHTFMCMARMQKSVEEKNNNKYYI